MSARWQRRFLYLLLDTTRRDIGGSNTHTKRNQSWTHIVPYVRYASYEMVSMRSRVLLGVFLPCLLLAQVDSGTITGTARDSLGSMLPGAQVTIASVGTVQEVELNANGAGIYVSPPLRPSQYVVTVTAKGFERSAKRLRLDRRNLP